MNFYFKTYFSIGGVFIINQFVDIHSHILPKIDDGAKNVETSLKMIEKLSSQGAKAIVASPHYYSNEISLDDFVEKRNSAFEELNSKLPLNSPKIIPAAEVFISKYLFNNEDLKDVCIDGTQYILIEHPFKSKFEEKEFSRLESLIYDYHLTPILVHVERYKGLMSSEQKIDELIDLGCLMQANVNSFYNERFFTKKKLLTLAKNGKIHLLGSDSHNMEERAPEFKKGFDEILKHIGRRPLTKMLQNSIEITETKITI